MRNATENSLWYTPLYVCAAESLYPPTHKNTAMTAVPSQRVFKEDFLFFFIIRRLVLSWVLLSIRTGGDLQTFSVRNFAGPTFTTKRFRCWCGYPCSIHKNKYKKRGYNQTALLSSRLALTLNLPHYPDMLIRSVNTLPQKQFNPQARLNNLKKAFCFNSHYDKLLSQSTPFSVFLLMIFIPAEQQWRPAPASF